MAVGPVEVRQIKGIPLAAKLAAVFALTVAVFMIGFGLFLAPFIERTVKAQILRSAADAARAAAQADLAAWTTTFGTADQGLRPAEVQTRVAGMSLFERKKYLEDSERLAQVEWNTGRFARFIGAGTRILAVELFRWENGQRGALLSASYSIHAGRTGTTFAPFRGAAPVKRGAGEAQEGLLTVAGDSSVVIRGSYPILDAAGEQRGEIAVHVDAGAVDSAISNLNTKVAYAAMLFVLVGAGVSFVLGRRMTRPLRLLQDDIRAVAAGDLDHHTKPRSTDEIGQLARTFDHMTRSLAEARKNERVAAASRHDLALAAEVTGGLFPDDFPRLPGWELAGLHDPSSEPAGGTYDVLAMPGGRVGFLMASASGGGVPAALVAAMARSYLRMAAEREADPGNVLREVNSRLSPDLAAGMHVKVLLAVLDSDTGRVTLANAGHTPLLHFHREGQGVEFVHSEGIALGFDKGPVFDQTLKVAEIELLPGDQAVLFAPATVALAGADGQPLGEKRLAGLVKREAGHGATACLERMGSTLRKFHGQPALGPDVTLLTFGRLA
jgi:serine phosphatase RsbU (regulator of sigma subunit)